MSHSVLCIITSEWLARFWYTLYQQLRLFNLFNLHTWKLKIASEKAELLPVEECDLLSAPHCTASVVYFPLFSLMQALTHSLTLFLLFPSFLSPYLSFLRLKLPFQPTLWGVVVDCGPLPLRNHTPYGNTAGVGPLGAQAC